MSYWSEVFFPAAGIIGAMVVVLAIVTGWVLFVLAPIESWIVDSFFGGDLIMTLIVGITLAALSLLGFSFVSSYIIYHIKEAKR